MLTIRDHHTGSLFHPWVHLGPKRRRLLERSWAGVFREYLLRYLPVDELAPHFCDGFGRPSKDLHVVLGALLLQQLHDLTDKQTVEAVAFNIAWHYALDIRHEDDAYLCERTLRNYRHLVIEQELDRVLFRALTDQLISSVGVDTRKQRLDSTAIRSYMRSLTRLGTIVEATSKFLRELRRRCPELHEQVDPELWRKYVDREGEGCFALTTPGESTRRLPEAASDLYMLLAQFRLTQAATLESYQLLERIFQEQCKLVEEESGQVAVAVQDPQEIPCDNVLNPADPEASYNKQRGVGYLVQIMETFSPGQEAGQELEQEDAQEEDPSEAPEDSAEADLAKPDLITHVAVGKMNVHDRSALVPALEDTISRGIAPEELVADTHYGSNDCLAEAKARRAELIAPSMPPKGKKQGKLTLEDFELDEAGRILRCPQGHAPAQVSVAGVRLQARFEPSICGACPLRSSCPAFGKERLQYTHDRVRQRRRRLAEQDPSFRERYRWRAGIEATMSRLKHQMGLARLRVRGMAAVRYRVLLRALGLNIHRVATWRGHLCWA